MSLSRSRRKRHRNWDYNVQSRKANFSTYDSPPDIAPDAQASLQSKAARRERIQGFDSRNGVQMDSPSVPRAKAGPCLRWLRAGARVVWPALVRTAEVHGYKDAPALGRFRLWARFRPDCRHT